MNAVRLQNALGVAACLALVGWFWARGEQFLAANGPTFDEPVHLAAGYSYWTTGDFRLNREDPPLLKILWAAPLVLKDRSLYPSDVAAATNNDHWHVGTAFLFNSRYPVRELLDPARRVNLALGCCVIALAGWWAFRLWNSRLAGISACAFSACDPNLLALSCILSTDIGLALFTLLASYLLWEYAAAPSRGLLLAAGVALGLALAAKFSALAVVAGLSAAGLVYVLRGGTLALPGISSPSGLALKAEEPNPPTLPTGTEGGVREATSSPSPLAGEGGERSEPGEGLVSSDEEQYPSPGGEAPPPSPARGEGKKAALPRGRAALEFAFRLALIAIITLAATYGFIHFDQWGSGLKFQLARAEHGDGMMYLNGERSRTGWYHYFLVLLPLKLPLGLIAGAVLACATGALRRVPRGAFLLVPPLTFFALASYSRVDLGVRVMLPVLPFLYVLAGGLACGGCCRLAGRVLLGVCVAWAAISAARSDPHPVVYFNELAGGPTGAIRFVGDSNVDWGQGLPELKAYMDANGIDAVYLSYFGTDRPEAYGIRFQPLPTYGRVGEPGGEAIPANAPRHVLVVSANNLLGIYLNDPETFAWVRTRTPTAVLGGCLYVFDLTNDPATLHHLRSLPPR